MKIRVPATSANLGPGFDSIGIAVDKYLTIAILEPSDKWYIEHNLASDIPTDENNLLLKVALKVASDLPPHHLKMTSDIPLARGLGSSSSVIVAGIELANQLAHLSLTKNEILQIANDIEGHPDNVAPAIFGNMVVSALIDESVEYSVSPFPDCALVAYVPDYELKTSDSRKVLPQTMSYQTAVRGSSIANLLVAAMANGDLKTAGKAIESDLFHEQYRQPLVKDFAKVKAIADSHQAYATYLSGAGPTVMIIAPVKEAKIIQKSLKEKMGNGEIFSLKIDSEGSRIIK